MVLKKAETEKKDDEAGESCETAPKLLSGPIDYSAIKLFVDGQQFVIHIMGDRHDENKGLCLRCADRNCARVTDFVNKLVHCSNCKCSSVHLFLEWGYITKIRKEPYTYKYSNIDEMARTSNDFATIVRTKHHSCMYAHYTDFRTGPLSRILEGTLMYIQGHMTEDLGKPSWAHTRIGLMYALAMDFGWIYPVFPDRSTTKKTKEKLAQANYENWWKIAIDKLSQIYFFSDNAGEDLKRIFPATNSFFESTEAKRNHLNDAWQSVLGQELSVYQGRTMHRVRKSLERMAYPTVKSRLWRYVKDSIAELKSAKAFGYLDRDGQEDHQNLAGIFDPQLLGVFDLMTQYNQDAEKFASTVQRLTELITTEFVGLVMEVYVLSRFFREFDIDVDKRVKQGVFYFGQYHTNHMWKFFNTHFSSQETEWMAKQIEGLDAKHQRCIKLPKSVNQTFSAACAPLPKV